MSVRRLTFQVERGRESDTFDIAVPARTPVCALLPAIVSLVDPTPEPDTRVDDWRLDRLTGTPIDDSKTLAENDVRDGELVILTSRHAPPLGLVEWDPSRTACVADPPVGSRNAIGPAVCVWGSISASLALAWAGSGTPGWSYLAVAAVGSCTAAVTAIADGSGAGVRVAAVWLAAAAGFLAVPGPSSAASVFLAASAGFSMSLLMLRAAVRPGSHATMVAAATLSGLVAVATVAPVIATVTTSAVGATLATAALALLAVAPRVAILAAGLRPDEHPDDCDARARLAHATLTGLVIGCAGSTAIGACLVAVGCRLSGSPALGGVAFTAVVAVAMSLRSRTHADERRRTAFVVSGLCCFTASFAIAVAVAPSLAAWTSAVLVAVGLTALRDRETGPGVARAAELLEYAVLASVLPMACWVGGAFTVVRESHLL